jgi:aquaporin TIP
MFEDWGLSRGMWLSAVGFELIMTFVLTFVLFAAVIEPRPGRWASLGGRAWGCIWVGVTMGALTVLGHNFTGAALNPARWFGTAIFELTIPSLQAQKPLQDHFVYWLGPIAGAMLAGAVYGTLIAPTPEESSAGAPPAKGPVGAAATLFRTKK